MAAGTFHGRFSPVLLQLTLNSERCQASFRGTASCPDFFLNFFHVPESPFSQINSDLVRLHFEALKAFHCGQIVSNTVFEDGKRKLCPNVSTIESKKQYFFQLHSLRIQTTLNPLQKHISNAILPLKKAHTHTHTSTPTTEYHYS